VFRAEGMKCVVKAEMKHTTETLTADGKLPEMLAVAEGANLSNQPANLALIVAQEHQPAVGQLPCVFYVLQPWSRT
jgi:hypothetical protein